MQLLRRIWQVLDGSQRRTLIAMQLLSVLMAISTVVAVAAILPFFSVLASPTSVDHDSLLHRLYLRGGFSDGHAFLAALAIAFVFLLGSANAINLFGSLVMNRFALRVGDELHCTLFGEYLQRDFTFHCRTDSATLASKVIHETGRVVSGVLQCGLLLITHLLSAVFIFVSVLILNQVVAVLAIAVLGICYAAVYLSLRGRLLRNGSAQGRQFAHRARLVREGFGAIREVILTQAAPLFVARFAASCTAISATVAATQAMAQAPRQIIEGVIASCLAGAALYLSARDSSQSWMAEIGFIGLAAYRLLPAVQQAYAAGVRIRADWPAFESIAEDLKRARHRRSCAAVAQDPAWRARPEREITLEAVTFRHSSDREPAINDLCARFSAGGVIGLVGANGCGKTTLVDLISGLLLPQHGSVRVDGIALNSGNCAAWRSNIACVPQRVFILDASMAENIAFGVAPHRIDRERLRQAIKMARLEECVARMPAGLQERLGEGGCRLSGGQRQRVGIARALYRDASVLILDEATSALDGDAERQIVDCLAALGRYRMTFLVAHRLNALRHCDVIFELGAGRIVRTGSPEKWLQAGLRPPVRATPRPTS